MDAEGFNIDDAKRYALFTLAALLLLAILTYAADWAVWSIRQAHHAGMSTLSVSRFVVAPLKGNKEEYYFDGTQDQPCSRSLFPQGGASACWYVARKPVVFER